MFSHVFLNPLALKQATTCCQGLFLDLLALIHVTTYNQVYGDCNADVEFITWDQGGPSDYFHRDGLSHTVFLQGFPWVP